MNIFKQLSLKYFNGSTNLEVGEKRDILTDRDKAFIFACRKFNLDFDKYDFFDGAHFIEETDFNPKYSLIKIDFSVQQPYNHLLVFVRIFSEQLNYSNLAAYRNLIRLFDNRRGDYFAVDIFKCIKEGLKNNYQKIYASSPKQRDLWSCGLCYAFSDVYYFSIIWSTYDLIINRIFIEIPAEEIRMEREARRRREQQQWESWQKQYSSQNSYSAPNQTPYAVLYNILQISPTNDKTIIKAAYRKLVLIHHPDRGGNEEKFKQITEAYEKLMQL